ncbi:hypothetical protein [Shewanella sp. FDAARGOS_354]|jgi:hypothetical protein|uniref:hypothetical protein n=1 Tax=Shewanella sp. FDAARGOS_354 TaxID=1930557 RepID=UPI000B51576D|nr:hypothetical protein [Shewanella sp. FDAARGOS_354]ASF16943.1 hypothetical protein CEQ32_19355 [Shewanella sp. FDAARGOS_354]MCD8550325.1 hypothetical protein [Shewanella xiamenensis]
MDKWLEISRLQFEAFSKIEHYDLQQKYVLLLAIRVTELCSDAYELCKRDRVASVPIIMRSALESYIDLMCTKLSFTHVENMNKSFEIFKVKMAGKTVKDDSLKIWEKFKLVGEHNLYSGFYVHLCRSAHGNLEALIRDHTVGDAISLGHRPDLSMVSVYRNQIIGIAVTALVEALEFVKFDGTQLKQLKVIQEQSGVGEYA